MPQMLTVIFRNDGTGTDEIGNYDVSVDVNGIVIERFRVTGHNRADGARVLVRETFAPDLLAACESLVDSLNIRITKPEQGEVLVCFDGSLVEIDKRARAAIARARGEG
jgi:hypothetical protein